jgi:type II secretory pathway pseudopilin PulG
MAIFNTLANNPQLTLLILLVVISLIALVTSLVSLLLERQANQLLLQRLSDLGYQLLEQREDYKQIEKHQVLAAKHQRSTDRVLQDIYGLIDTNNQKLDRIKDQSSSNGALSTEVPSQNNYEQAIRMAKDGIPGEKIQHLCGLTEGEVTLILDLHQ